MLFIYRKIYFFHVLGWFSLFFCLIAANRLLLQAQECAIYYPNSLQKIVPLVHVYIAVTYLQCKIRSIEFITMCNRCNWPIPRVSKENHIRFDIIDYISTPFQTQQIVVLWNCIICGFLFIPTQRLTDLWSHQFYLYLRSHIITLLKI